ncbi:MAG: hypothetical protein EOM26_12975 [Alphaproteobacteria bacterium]|nr:hypothetical protein [Alphaproteobacteria bacterium]
MASMAREGTSERPANDQPPTGDEERARENERAVQGEANDHKPAETTLERIRRERIEAQQRERQSDRDFDRER